MNKAIYFFSFLMMTQLTSFSQENLNAYKYVIVPNKFDFLKEIDQYQINSLTKFLFNKYGFVAYMQDEEYPLDLQNNRCLGLLADVINNGGMFVTKLRVDLKNCNGKLIQSSKNGESREKAYDKAYTLALREAFTSFESMKYKYQPNETILSNSASSSNVGNAKEQNEIAQLREEIKTLREDKAESIIEDEEITTNKDEEVMNAAVPLTKIETSNPSNLEKEGGVLYAQAVDMGYQIVDSAPKVVMILYITAAKDVFIVKDKNAIVFKKEAQWIYSENDGKNIKETVLNIKF